MKLQSEEKVDRYVSWDGFGEVIFFFVRFALMLYLLYQ